MMLPLPPRAWRLAPAPLLAALAACAPDPAAPGGPDVDDGAAPTGEVEPRPEGESPPMPGMGAMAVVTPYRDEPVDGPPERVELVWRDDVSGAASYWRMIGTQIEDHATLPLVAGQAAGSHWTIEAVGDFDRDGRDDLVWRERAVGVASIWLMDGATIKAHAASFNLGAPWRIIGAHDVNVDGHVDLVMRNDADNTVHVWEMNGTTRVAGRTLTRVADLGFEPTIGDVDGNGYMDLVWFHRPTGQVHLWLASGPNLAGVSARVIYTLCPADQPVCHSPFELEHTADFDGDGRAELIWVHRTTRQRWVWFLDGAAFTPVAPTLPTVPGTWRIAGVRRSRAAGFELAVADDPTRPLGVRGYRYFAPLASATIEEPISIVGEALDRQGRVAYTLDLGVDVYGLAAAGPDEPTVEELAGAFTHVEVSATTGAPLDDRTQGQLLGGFIVAGADDELMRWRAMSGDICVDPSEAISAVVTMIAAQWLCAGELGLAVWSATVTANPGVGYKVLFASELVLSSLAGGLGCTSLYGLNCDMLALAYRGSCCSRAPMPYGPYRDLYGAVCPFAADLPDPAACAPDLPACDGGANAALGAVATEPHLDVGDLCAMPLVPAGYPSGTTLELKHLRWLRDTYDGVTYVWFPRHMGCQSPTSGSVYRVVGTAVSPSGCGTTVSIQPIDSSDPADILALKQGLHDESPIPGCDVGSQFSWAARWGYEHQWRTPGDGYCED